MGHFARAKNAIANSKSQLAKATCLLSAICYLLFPFGGGRMGIPWLKCLLVTYTRGEDFYATFRKSDQFDTLVVPFNR